MEELIELFQQYPHIAVVISIITSILVAIAGVVPSVFITAANILFFGVVQGTLISFAGESIGAAVSFILYRYGFRKRLNAGKINNKRIILLLSARGKEAFKLIFLLRLLPFIPSGIITFISAVGNVTFTTFIMASSLGKIPALLIEAWSVYHVTEFNITGKVILSVAVVMLIIALFKKKQENVK